MPKKLIPYGYEINVANNTIGIPGNYAAERILLITNVTKNKILYNFADPTAGYTSIVYDVTDDYTQINTVLPLNDTANMSATEDDILQIFVEEDFARIGFEEAMIDPVNKLRVSNPENLIDTDFEYGLQSSKWETLQTVLNIPTIYSTSGDTPLEGLQSIITTSGSKQVKVTVDVDTDLKLGDPISVQGTTNTTAEGYFLVSGIASTKIFFYEMDKEAVVSEDISGSYSTVIPAKFFEGSNLALDLSTSALVTDEANPSTITVTTSETHGLNVGTKVYLRNTIGPKILEIADPTQTAPDGRPYVDSTAELTVTNTVDATTPIGGGGYLEFPVVTWDWEPTYVKYLSAVDIDTTLDQITWTAHGLSANAAIVFQTQVRGQTNAGLTDGTVYYANPIDADTIELYTDYQTLASRVNLTALDITRGHPRIGLVYKIEGNEGNDRYTAFYMRNIRSNITGEYNIGNVNNTNSNSFTWDITNHMGTGRVPVEGIIYQIYHSGNLASGGNYVTTTFTGRNYLGLGSSNVTYNVGGKGSNTTTESPNLNVTRCIYLSSSRYYITVTYQATGGVITRDKFGNPTNSFNIRYRIRLRDVPQTMNADHSGSDLTQATFGLGRNAGSRVIAFQSRTPGTAYQNSADNYSYLVNQRNNGRYGTGIARYNYQVSTTNPLGIITTNYNDTNREEFSSNSTHIYYSMATDLSSFRNLIYAQAHGLEDGDTALVTVSNYSTSNRFAFVDGNGNSVGINQATFNATVSVVSDNYFRLQINQSPNTDDISEFPEEFTLETQKVNPLYNTIYIQNHKIVGNAIATYNTAGGVIGGLTNNTLYSLQYVNDSRLIVKDASVADNSNSATTTEFGSSSNAQNQAFTINVEDPIGFTPANVTITGVQFRGDFSARNEFVTLNFGDGTSYNIGQSGGQDTSVWLDDPNWVAKNVSPLLTTIGGKKSVQITASPTSAINFTVSGMSRWWEIRFQITAVSGDILLSSSGSGLQTFTVKSLQGAYDGVYNIASIPTTNQFTVSADFEIPKRQYEFDAFNDVSQGTDVITLGVSSPYTPHNLYQGEQLSYNQNSQATDIINNVNVTALYAIPINQYEIQLAESYASALAGQRIQLTPASTSETQYLETTSLVKSTVQTGSVAGAIGGSRLTGSGTKFLSDYKRGDTVWVIVDGRLQGFTVDFITTDEELYILETFPAAFANAEYFILTQSNLRPDGYSLHKSFDGGVDITAGTSPNSKIVRQSRKYFRYQSGKGIQNSYAINFSPAKTVASLTFSSATGSNIVTVKCQEPHNLKVNDTIEMAEAVVTTGNNVYNGTFSVAEVVDLFTYTYVVGSVPTQQKAAGFPEYSRANWRDSAIRAGMFDDQNGFFFEYDGQDLYAVRRSSTLQLSGTVNATFGSQVITGNNTSFTTQLAVGNMIVIRGQSYRIVEISSDNRLVFQPAYRGVSARNIKITKTVDVKTPSSEFSNDPMDGTGPTGFVFNVHKIQMAYHDYSWYGAGKIRYGFKDRNGHVFYFHEYIHNNRLNESYFRSGNLPGRYEIENGNNPSSAPTLFHFGTSIIMDGTFDDDESYLFTASSKPMVFAQGAGQSFTTSGASTFEEITLNAQRVYVYALPVSAANAALVKVGQLISDPDDILPEDSYITQVVISGANSKIYASYPATKVVPVGFTSIASGKTLTIGEGAFGNGAVDLTRPIPLISIRLAPSVDSGLTGKVGEREIINRMQLKLKSAGVTTNKDVEIFFILNGLPSKLTYDKVASPSLSELISHDTGDIIQRGTVIFSTKSSSGSIEIDLDKLIDMGNSIMGGDSVFPAGPDLLTVAVQPQDTSGISSTSPMQVSGKISWSESQA